MFTKIDKAIVAAIMALVFILQTNGVILPDFLTQDWVTSTVGLFTPFLVWWMPNKAAP